MTDLVVGLESPVLTDDGVTEVADLPEHGLHEGGAEMGGLVPTLLPVTALDELCGPTVVVEGRAIVEELTATLHVPADAMQGVRAEYSEPPNNGHIRDPFFPATLSFVERLPFIGGSKCMKVYSFVQR